MSKSTVFYLITCRNIPEKYVHERSTQALFRIFDTPPCTSNRQHLVPSVSPFPLDSVLVVSLWHGFPVAPLFPQDHRPVGLSPAQPLLSSLSDAGHRPCASLSLRRTFVLSVYFSTIVLALRSFCTCPRRGFPCLSSFTIRVVIITIRASSCR
ncbi:hypothetical protein BJ165DRAFT_1456582 [Panaeolus papilionaceus]|nr:hypothetical protein BJ165DRAFT_1456582 [Panaeolus papilionaceus]